LGCDKNKINYKERKMIIDEFDSVEIDHLWLTVKNLSVNIIQKEDGVAVDIYPLDHEDEDPIVSTYVFFREGIVEE
jgi:hypothetical protein